MSVLKMINFRELSAQITGEPTRIKQQDTAERYQHDINALEELLTAWIKFTKDRQYDIQTGIDKRRR